MGKQGWALGAPSPQDAPCSILWRSRCKLEGGGPCRAEQKRDQQEKEAEGAVEAIRRQSVEGKEKRGQAESTSLPPMVHQPTKEEKRQAGAGCQHKPESLQINEAQASAGTPNFCNLKLKLNAWAHSVLTDAKHRDGHTSLSSALAKGVPLPGQC